MFQHTEEQRRHLILCLAKSHLVFKVLKEVTIADESNPTWKILDELITLQLTEHNIHITPPLIWKIKNTTI